MATTATPSEDGSYYLVNGEKLWCTNGPVAELLVVMCVGFLPVACVPLWQDTQLPVTPL